MSFDRQRPLKNHYEKIIDCHGLNDRPRNNVKTRSLSLRGLRCCLSEDKAIFFFRGLGRFLSPKRIDGGLETADSTSREQAEMDFGCYDELIPNRD